MQSPQVHIHLSLSTDDIGVAIEPIQIVVEDGGTAFFNCSPLIPLNPPVLLVNGRETNTTQLSFVDTVGDRMYTFVNATSSDNGTMLQCHISSVFSDVATLIITVEG